MALDYTVAFPGQSADADSNYPFGAPRDPVSEPGDGTATPITAAVFKDLLGFVQRLLELASVTPSEVPDTAVASDYCDALQALIATAVAGQSASASAQPVYAAYGGGSIGSALSDAELAYRVSRVGSLVVVSGVLTISAGQSTADIVSAEAELPSWAAPSQGKALVLCDFGSDYQVYADAGEGEGGGNPRQLRFHRRATADGAADNFDADAAFTLVYTTAAALS